MRKPVLVEGVEKQTAALRYKAIGLLARREQSRNELQRKLHIKALENGWQDAVMIPYAGLEALSGIPSNSVT